MSLADQKFTIRQVAEIHGEKIPTLQSWVDKGWARVTAAPGPGQARELTIVDVYYLSIALAFTRIGVNPQTANRITWRAIHQPDNDRTAVLRGAQERTARERGYPDWATFFSKYKLDPANPTAANRDLTVDIGYADLISAFHSRATTDPYFLFADVGDFSAVGPVIQQVEPAFLNVKIIRLRASEQIFLEMVTTGSGFYLNLTELLFYVDEALKAKLCPAKTGPGSSTN